MTDKPLRQPLLDAMGPSPSTDPSAILAFYEKAVRRQRMLTLCVWLFVAALPMAVTANRWFEGGRRIADGPEWLFNAFAIARIAWPALFVYGVYCLVKLRMLGRSVSLAIIAHQLALIERRLARQDAER